MYEKITLPEHTWSYKEYRLLVESLLSEGKVTGANQNESLLEYTKLNLHRMNRWEKTWVPLTMIADAVMGINTEQKWVVLTEGWCGDAAQQIPVFEQLALMNGLISTHYLLRDENLEFMDHFLTNGARSIPVVLCLNDMDELLWKWGPRPEEASRVLDDAKAKGMDQLEMKKELHSWYVKNNHQALQNELMGLITAMAR